MSHDNPITFQIFRTSFEFYKPKMLYLAYLLTILQKTVTHYSNNMLNTVCCHQRTALLDRYCHTSHGFDT